MIGTPPRLSGGQVPPPPDGPEPRSLRRRLVGDRSGLFIGFVLVGLALTIVGGLRPGSDPWDTVGHAAFFVAVLLIGSPDRHMRAAAYGLFVSQLWWALDVPLWVAVPVGLFGATVEFALSVATIVLDVRAPLETRASLQPLVRRIVALKVGSAILTGASLALVAGRIAIDHGLSPTTTAIGLACALAIFGCIQVRDARQFGASVVGRG